ncbi:plasmid segregation centromere-binding protein ParR [Rivularia sp. UHCC 0363]|uniref:plasmid segregation centromere-binding protein ParR n=1 Tax=Rivularia sp. UHCC 0363 TaxID=3110244 RepID=UPI002B216003|nr:plasmid segregation centromere-binding protein ParR [Rivularia sp. UHCC 0363]MEA5595349.1 plasmid segregation centromere-binding protein ParR [Rivularia sp. UHCC 0363]
MFQWSKKVVKSVTFNPGVADESLLDVVERHLEKEPDKTFSDLCKEALWQALCVPESVRPDPQPTSTATPKPPSEVGEHIADLERKLADLEERFFTRESNRLVTMEQHLTQLSQQVAQLAMMVNQGSVVHPSTQSKALEVFNNTSLPAPVVNNPYQEEDPLIRRMSELVDDF